MLRPLHANRVAPETDIGRAPDPSSLSDNGAKHFTPRFPQSRLADNDETYFSKLLRGAGFPFNRSSNQSRISFRPSAITVR
jgi:hypothetical protein